MSALEIKIQVAQIRNQLLTYGQQIDTFFFYDSNVEANKNNAFSYNSYDMLAAYGCKNKVGFETEKPFNKLKDFLSRNPTWLFGYFGYDLKNKIENLTSSNDDFLMLPNINFIEPEIVIYLKNDALTLIGLQPQIDLKKVADDILQSSQSGSFFQSEIKPVNKISRHQYIENIERIKHHIQIGNIYEMNYCIPFEADYESLNGIELFKQLNAISKAPFAAYAKIENVEIICASPERFLKKEGNKLISQPIKGTQKRGQSFEEDELLKSQLKQSKKEQSENVMIVDLVRNDLSKSATRNSVHVEELFGVYSFQQVHQMISTISAQLKDDVHFIDAIKNAFPMGSMTGAPKIRAMQLIENFESMKRGIYSGALGYFTPENNFDFNVIIRSIVLNNQLKKLQFCVGSAITSASDAASEYEECLLKANALFKVLASD